MTSQPASSARRDTPPVTIAESAKQAIDERVAGMTDGELRLHQSLNHMERTPGVYGDIPAVAGLLEYEAASIADELTRRT